MTQIAGYLFLLVCVVWGAVWLLLAWTSLDNV